MCESEKCGHPFDDCLKLGGMFWNRLFPFSPAFHDKRFRIYPIETIGSQLIRQGYDFRSQSLKTAMDCECREKRIGINQYVKHLCGGIKFELLGLEIIEDSEVSSDVCFQVVFQQKTPAKTVNCADIARIKLPNERQQAFHLVCLVKIRERFAYPILKLSGGEFRESNGSQATQWRSCE